MAYKADGGKDLNDGVRSHVIVSTERSVSRKLHVFDLLVDETDVFLINAVRPEYTDTMYVLCT